RLQDQTRQQHVSSAVVDLLLHDQIIAKASALDLEIRLDDTELVGERYELGLTPGQHVTKDLRQSLDTHLRLGLIRRNQLRDGIQAIEQEMRIHLCPQRGKLRGSRQLAQLLLTTFEHEHPPPVLIEADQTEHGDRQDRYQGVHERGTLDRFRR